VGRVLVGRRRRWWTRGSGHAGEKERTGKIMRFSRENRARMPRTREGSSCREKGRARDLGKVLGWEGESFEKRPSRLSPHSERRFVRRANIRPWDNTPKFRRRSGRPWTRRWQMRGRHGTVFGKRAFCMPYKWRSRHTGMLYDKQAYHPGTGWSGRRGREWV